MMKTPKFNVGDKIRKLRGGYYNIQKAVGEVYQEIEVGDIVTVASIKSTPDEVTYGFEECIHHFDPHWSVVEQFFELVTVNWREKLGGKIK